MSKQVARVKGTQDFLDLRLFNYFITAVKHYIELYNFKEIETPIIEHTELFLRGLGTETDVVTKQMYMLETQEASNEKLCLRPEATASIMRAFLETKIATSPWKVYTYGPMFRHERPQKGRYRQFHQLSMEILQAKSIDYDSLFIAMLDRLFNQRFMLSNYDLLINFLGCPQDRALFKEKLHSFMMEKPVCQTCTIRKQKNILRIFDCKSEECQEIYKSAPKLTDFLCQGCESEWDKLKKALDLLSVSYTHVPTLVRGLDYYNKTVFEFVSNNLGAQNAFCSGGRYDILAKEFGSKEEVPALGAAIGIERVLLMLELIQDKLALPVEPALSVLVPLSEEQNDLALLLSEMLHDKGIKTEIILDGNSVKSKMRKANLSGAQFALLIGSQEQQEQKITVKNMSTGQETVIAQKELVDFLKEA